VVDDLRNKEEAKKQARGKRSLLIECYNGNKKHEFFKT
jgi:hypothetical protein